MADATRSRVHSSAWHDVCEECTNEPLMHAACIGGVDGIKRKEEPKKEIKLNRKGDPPPIRFEECWGRIHRIPRFFQEKSRKSSRPGTSRG